MITSARQGRKEKTEKSLWNFFFSPLLGCIFGGGGGGGGRPGAQAPKPCPHRRDGRGLAAAPGSPPGQSLPPLSPALGAHWKTLVNQQMMPSNFPISRAPKGCSFLQLAQERLQPPPAGLCTPRGPGGRSPAAWPGDGPRWAQRHSSTAAQSLSASPAEHRGTKAGRAVRATPCPLIAPGPFPRGRRAAS